MYGKSLIVFRSDVSDMVAAISGSSFRRELGFGTAWTRLRVGVRMSFKCQQANFFEYGTGITPRFGIGLSQGSTSVFRRATAGHWFGAITTGAVWTVNPAGSPGAGAFNFSFGTMAPAKKVGSTLTAGTNFAQSVAVGGGYQDFPTIFTNQVYIFVDITKGSPNYSFRVFTIANPANGGNQDRATWLSQMQLSTPTQINYSFQAAQTVAVDEGADGVADSINIFNELPIEAQLWDIGLVRFS